jgi:hypothetical protein
MIKLKTIPCMAKCRELLNGQLISGVSCKHCLCLIVEAFGVANQFVVVLLVLTSSQIRVCGHHFQLVTMALGLVRVRAPVLQPSPVLVLIVVVMLVLIH